LIIIVSWYAHFESLLVLNPAYPAMQYNTALAFMLSGIAIILALSGRFIAARGVALVVAAASLLIFIQDPFRVDFGIDRLLFDPYITTATIVPGRMAPHTAIAFMLTCIGIVLATRRTTHRCPSLIAVLGSTVMAIGIVAVVGYLTGFEKAYGWGRFTKMAVLTAAGFVTLGIGLFAVAWGEERSTTSLTPRWLFAPVSIAVVAASIILTQALITFEDQQIHHVVEAQATTVQHEVETEIESHIAMVERISQRWEYDERPMQARWEADVDLNFGGFPGLQTIAWVDRDNRAQWTMPRSNGAIISGDDLGATRELRSMLDTARLDRQTTISRPLDRGRGDLEIFVARPMFVDNANDGYIVGVFRVNELFNAVLSDRVTPTASISVFDGEHPIFQRVGDNQLEASNWSLSVPATIRNQTWTLRVWPGSNAPQRSLMPYGALIVGCILAVLLGLIVWLLQQTSYRSRALQHANITLKIENTERINAESELRRSSVALTQSNRALQEFAYVASHDLKAPLVSLHSLATMLRDDTRDLLQGDAQLYLERIIVNASRMRNLLDDLLHLSRVGRDDAEISNVDLRSVITGVTDQLGQLLHEQGAEIAITGSLPLVSANPVRLHQIFANLVDNAVKYTPTGRTPRIEISATDHDDMWQIEVRDNGSGIPEEYHEKVFVMFQRLPNGRSLNPDGTGMGMAIVARIVESWGGRCWIGESNDQGTTLCLTLPKSLTSVMSLQSTQRRDSVVAA